MTEATQRTRITAETVAALSDLLAARTQGRAFECLAGVASRNYGRLDDMTVAQTTADGRAAHRAEDANQATKSAFRTLRDLLPDVPEDALRNTILLIEIMAGFTPTEQIASQWAKLIGDLQYRLERAASAQSRYVAPSRPEVTIALVTLCVSYDAAQPRRAVTV